MVPHQSKSDKCQGEKGKVDGKVELGWLDADAGGYCMAK